MAFLALALVALQQAAEPVHAFVELSAQPAMVFVEQPVRLTIRFGVEKEYLRHNLLQLFTRPLDIPVQLEFGWKTDTAYASTLGPTFALGEEIVRPTRAREEQRAGASFVVLELERAFTPDAPGRLEIPGPVLHFAYATRFGEDLVSGAVPLDRSNGLVQGAPLVLEVAPFPAEGRPAGFSNAVGKFTLAAEVFPRELEVGEKLQLVLTISGPGNLARLAPPRLDGFEGLHLLGITEELKSDTRTLHCELVAESPKAREVPAIALDSFDPLTRAYIHTSTKPIPLKVRARAPHGVPVIGFDAGPALYWFYGTVALVLSVLAWGIWLFFFRRRSGRAAP
jgi:hypothetical protein